MSKSKNSESKSTKKSGDVVVSKKQQKSIQLESDNGALTSKKKNGMSLSEMMGTLTTPKKKGSASEKINVNSFKEMDIRDVNTLPYMSKKDGKITFEQLNKKKELRLRKIWSIKSAEKEQEMMLDAMEWGYDKMIENEELSMSRNDLINCLKYLKKK